MSWSDAQGDGNARDLFNARAALTIEIRKRKEAEAEVARLRLLLEEERSRPPSYDALLY